MSDKKKVIVSGCLAGLKCRWDGRSKINNRIKRLVDEGLAIALCPEVLGGLPTPRAAAEIDSGDGEDVLDGRAKVIDADGRDITAEFIIGAQAVLKKAQKENITTVYLKSKSPSCGLNYIRRAGELIDGKGVTTSLLLRHGFKIVSIN
jgi:uncharacterized protein YbbK (DUF523 family)